MVSTILLLEFINACNGLSACALCKCVCVCIRCLFEHHWYSASRCLFETTLLNTVCNCTSECVFFTSVSLWMSLNWCQDAQCPSVPSLYPNALAAPPCSNSCSNVCVCVVSNSSSGIQLILSLYFKFFSELYSGISHLIII